jgi:hypothetical protein
MMDKALPYILIGCCGLLRIIPQKFGINPILGSVSYAFVALKRPHVSIGVTLLLLFITDLLVHFTRENTPIAGIWMVYIYPLHIINGFLSKAIIQKPNLWVNIGVSGIITGFNFWVLSCLGFYLTFYE